VQPTDSDLARLESSADELLATLTLDRPPFVVEFAGSPKAGKSTTIDILTHFFKRRGFKVWAPTEGASKRTPYHLRRDLVAFNTWTLNYAISELLVAYHNVDRHHLIMLDRGAFDSLAWMGLLKKRGNITEEEFAVFRAFALHPKWSNLVSRLYLFRCPPEESLKREHEAKLTRGPGTAMNPDMLRDLLEQYQDLATALSTYPVQVVETSDTTRPLSTSYRLAIDLLAMMQGGARGS